MKTTTHLLLKACSISVALLGSAAVVLAISLPDAAYADNGKGNGGGNGKSSGNGNGGGKASGGGGGNGNNGAKSGGNGGSDYSASSKASGNSKLKPKKTAKAVTPAQAKVGKAATAKIKPKHKAAGSDGLAHPSELGALNAAHANPRALENAAPNSRVGRIAAYRDTVLAGQELAAKLAEKTALLETLSPPDRPLAEIDTDLALAKTEVATQTDAVAKLEADLLAAGGTDPLIEADLLTARTLLSDAEMVAEDLQAEQLAAVEFETLTTEVADLSQKVADQPLVERSALEAAANKPVTDDVEAAVRALLGL